MNPDDPVSDDDDVPPEVTHELNRLKALARPHQALSAVELMPKRDVHGTRSNELLDPRLAPRWVGKKRFSWFRGRLCGVAPRQHEASSSRT